MLISILHYLRYIRQDSTVTLTQLRTIGSLGTDTEHTMFDIDESRFVQAITRIAQHFNIQINVHYSNRTGVADGRWLGNPAVIFGRSHEIVPVVAFGLHFELIISSAITGHHPITDEILNSIGGVSIHNFIPVIMTPIMNSKKNPVSVPIIPIVKDPNQRLIDELLIGIIENKDTIQFLNKEIKAIGAAIAQHKDEIQSRELILESYGIQINDDTKQMLQVEISSLCDIISKYIDESVEKTKLVNQMEKYIKTSTDQIQKLFK